MNDAPALSRAAGRVLALSFRVDDERYLMRAEDVVRVIEPTQLNRIPRLPAPLLGIAHHRGRIYTVFDFAALLFDRPRRARVAPSARLLVLDHGQRNRCIVVDVIDEIAPVNLSASRPGVHPAIQVLSHRGRAANVILTERLGGAMLQATAEAP